MPSPVLIEQAVALARWAPNHRVTQPWRFYHLGEQAKHAVIELNAGLIAAKKSEAAADFKRQRWQAIPGWLVVTCIRSDDTLKAQEDYAACCCAVHNLTLYLWSHNIGCKWTTGAVTRDSGFYQQLEINPDAETVVGLIWYGYPDENPSTKRKPVEDILFWRD